jgi:hypothetical protein
VLQLVTLPNLLLAALPFLPQSEEASGHLDITDNVKQDLKTLLLTHKIELEFSHGHWAGLAKSIGTYDLILTAETIYAEESVDDLLSVLRSASRQTSPNGLAEKLDKVSITDDWSSDLGNDSVVLVAAKVSSRVLLISLIIGAILWRWRRAGCILATSRTTRWMVERCQGMDAGSGEKSRTHRVWQGGIGTR